MSMFIKEASGLVDAYTTKLSTYGNAYAMARAQGQTPWEASVSCASFEKGLTQEAVQPIRRIIDGMIEERNGDG